MTIRYKTDAERRRIAGLNRARLMGHVVEGKLVTTREIADRFGVTIECARKRARRGPFPLTWEGLEGRKKHG